MLLLCGLLGGLWTTAGVAGAIECVSLVVDELIQGGLAWLVEWRRGGEVGFIRFSNEYNKGNKVTKNMSAGLGWLGSAR